MNPPCVYKKVSWSVTILLVFYVDDILLMDNDTEMLISVELLLLNTFTMKDLGEAIYILRMCLCIDRVKGIIGLS